MRITIVVYFSCNTKNENTKNSEPKDPHIHFLELFSKTVELLFEGSVTIRFQFEKEKMTLHIH